jgi:hypothetical protein
MGVSAALPITVSDFPRRKFTAADVQDILKAGILSHDDHVELIEGELIDLASHGPRHRDLRHTLRKDVKLKGPLYASTG